MSSSSNASSTATVILGSGIIGLSTAYYLSESGNTDPKSICLVDASPQLFRCASGLAGGFLAADCMFKSTYHCTLYKPWLSNHTTRMQGSLHPSRPSAPCPTNFTHSSHKQIMAARHGATHIARAYRSARTAKKRRSVGAERIG